MKNTLLALLLLITPLSQAAATKWKIIPEQSVLTFTASQSDSPVTGQFKKFFGDIDFDPNHLADSSIKIYVAIGSLSTTYPDIQATLVTPDWFNSKVFPQAVFTATKFTKTANNIFTADGTLTIRDKTQPVTLTFTLENKGEQTWAKGTTTIKRTAFGVGNGKWAATDDVKDDVQINFTLTAVKS